MNAKYALLDGETLLHIRGPDSLNFLQGQTTCDTRQVSGERSVPGAYCTPQGRVVCDFVLSQLGEEHYCLRMRSAIAQHAAAVFGKYIVFSKAELDTDSTGWHCVGVWGTGANATIKTLFGDTPDTPMGTVSGRPQGSVGAGIAVQMDEQGQRFECYLPAGSELVPQLAASVKAASETQWRLQEIRAGWARIEAQTIEMEVPQVLNYDLTGHISFDKGCYTGQEVVARLHYRGKSKRRLYLAQSPVETTAGAPLFTPGQSQSIGNVFNCAQGESVLALVSSTQAGIEQGLHLVSEDGPALTLLDLPYPPP